MHRFSRRRSRAIRIERSSSCATCHCTRIRSTPRRFWKKRELGKFNEALDILFDKQPEWGSHRDPKPELIPSYFEPLGIPREKMERSYVIQKHGAKIKRDEDDAVRAGVTGTPSLFVNGQKVRPLSEESLRRALETALLSK